MVIRKKIEAMVFDEIVKNNKKIDFKAIGECNEFNYAFRTYSFVSTMASILKYIFIAL